MTQLSKLAVLAFFSMLLFTGCNNHNSDNQGWVINEVMIDNQNSNIDEFGARSGWIEIYNNTAKTQNLAGCFLTDDPNNPKKYPIPIGDVLTQVKPHQQVIFYTDNEPFRGTFHVNFKFDPNKENYVALYRTDGKTLIGELRIPAGMKPDQTYGYVADGVKFGPDGENMAQVLERVTPSSNNQVVGENPKLVSLRANDKSGLTITLTSMLVVFTGLLALFLVFNFLGIYMKKISQAKSDKKDATIDATDNKVIKSISSDNELSYDMLAAISAAIYELEKEIHDKENKVLTFQDIQRHYSPWSSKIQTLRKMPR